MAVASQGLPWTKLEVMRGEGSVSQLLIDAVIAVRDLTERLEKPYIAGIVPVLPRTKFNLLDSVSIVDDAGEATEKRFQLLAEQWHEETSHLSTADIELHPAFLRVVAMGADVVPFILRDLRDNRGHWFSALEALTEQNAAAKATTVAEAREAWLRWGAERHLI